MEDIRRMSLLQDCVSHIITYEKNDAYIILTKGLGFSDEELESLGFNVEEIK